MAPLTFGNRFRRRLEESECGEALKVAGYRFSYRASAGEPQEITQHCMEPKTKYEDKRNQLITMIDIFI